MIQSTPQRFSRLLSVGIHRPSRVVTNDDLIAMGLDSNDEWIVQRTGIHERRWATEEETLHAMCLAASRIAIERAGIAPEQIGMVVLSTVSVYQQSPSLSPQLAHELGAVHAGAIDVNAGCAGFCYGVGLADGMVRSGQADHVLVIGADRLSDFTDPTSRMLGFLLSDGAGAVVIGPSDTPGISPTLWGNDGSRHEVITTGATWQEAMRTGEWPYLQMEGQTVFRWATGHIAHVAADILSAAGIAPEELDVFLPHQANNRIIDSMLRHLHLPEDITVARDIVRQGNSSSASIPLAMEALLEDGTAHGGQTALLIGFGAGLTYAGQVVELPTIPTPGGQKGTA